MRRAEVYKLGPTWLIAQRDGKWWCADYGTRYTRHRTHQEALDAALAALGLDRPAEHREAP